MEADWEVEIGGDAPVIDARWADFIDLRREPGRAATLVEVSDLPVLARALVRLNSAGSPVWTSKSDVWEQHTFDPDEMDAPPGTAAASAIACYIDLLPRSDQEWRVHGQAVAACTKLCGRLRQVPVRSCRADLVVRRASIAPDLPDHGITAYLTACGSTLEEARATLGVALTAFVDCVLWADDASAGSSKLQ
jgi:hypothetical protein